MKHQAAHHVRSKACALFIGKGHHLQRTIQLHIGIIQAGHHFQSSQHAQIAVVASASSHGIDVRTRHDRRHIQTASACPDNVADLINLHTHAQITHPADHLIAARLVLIRQGQAADAAPVDCTNLRQLRNTLQQAFAING